MAIDFHPLDQNKPVIVYRRNLPHWRQDGATYFVTYRLADALPAQVVDELAQLARMLAGRWTSEEMSLQADREYFRRLKKYLDRGHGSCWLRGPRPRSVVESSFTRFDGERYELGSYAVMPNHVHVLVRPLGNVKLEEILHSWKSYTANAVNRILNRNGRVWQDEYYDRLVRHLEEFRRTSKYILSNGRRTGAKM